MDPYRSLKIPNKDMELSLKILIWVVWDQTKMFWHRKNLFQGGVQLTQKLEPFWSTDQRLISIYATLTSQFHKIEFHKHVWYNFFISCMHPSLTVPNKIDYASDLTTLFFFPLFEINSETACMFYIIILICFLLFALLFVIYLT